MSRLTTMGALVLAGGFLAAVPAAQAAPATCQGHAATIVGTPGDDRITGTPGADVIVARGGDDTVRAGAGDDLVCGGDGADTLRGGPGADELYGQRDGQGFDRGGSFRYPDTLSGGPGADLLDIGGDARPTDQGGSHGVVTYESAGHGVTVDLAAGTASGEGADRIAVQPGLEVVGTPYDDVLLGSAGADTLIGRTGDDRIDGRDGADDLRPDEPRATPDHDVVDGGPGPDSIVAWRGRDVLRGGGGDDGLTTFSGQPARIYGEAGDDGIASTIAEAPGFVVDGGDGTDRGYLGMPAASPSGPHRPPGPTITLRVGDGTATRSGTQIGTVAGIEVWSLGDYLRWIFYGTDGPDTVTGSYYQPFRAWTYGGDDDVTGSGKRDHIDAGDGHDAVSGQEGRDTCLNAEVVTSCEVVGP
jgi:Ca2+-binding RTX toxin-like protein